MVAIPIIESRSLNALDTPDTVNTLLFDYKNRKIQKIMQRPGMWSPCNPHVGKNNIMAYTWEWNNTAGFSGKLTNELHIDSLDTEKRKRSISNDDTHQKVPRSDSSSD
jgi:hypothetical protein